LWPLWTCRSEINWLGLSLSLTLRPTVSLGLRPDFYCRTEYGIRRTVAGLLIWGALSDERTGRSFTIASGPSQRSHSWVRVPWDSWPYLLSQIWDFFESDVTTDGQSASLSWYKAPIWGLRPDFYFHTEYGIRLTVTFLIPWGTLSDERTGLAFVCAAGPCQCNLSRVLVPWDLRPYFTVSDMRLPFSSPPTTRRVTVEVFDPAFTFGSWPSLYSLGTDRTDNMASNNSSIVGCMFVSANT
jgi:hypothetical protein